MSLTLSPAQTTASKTSGSVGTCTEIQSCQVITGSGTVYVEYFEVDGANETSKWSGSHSPGTGCIGSVGFSVNVNTKVKLVVMNIGTNFQAQIDNWN